MDLLGSKVDINESSKNIIVNLMSLVAELHRMCMRGATKALQDFAFWVKTRVMINFAVVDDAGMAADFCRQANTLQGLSLAPEDHLRIAFQYSTRNIGSTSGVPSAHSQLLKLGILLEPFSREIRSRLLNAALSAINESMSEAEEIAQGGTVSPSRLFLELTRDSSGMYRNLQLLEELRAVTKSMIEVRFPERGSIPPPNLRSENAAHQRKLAQLLAIMTTLRKYFQHLDGVLAFGLKEVKACLDADEAGLAQLRFVSLVARFCLLQVLQPEPWTEFHFIFVARRFLRGVRFALGNKKGFARLAGLLHFTCKHFGISTDMRAEFLKYLSSPTLYVDVCERPGQKQALIFALLLADAELVTPTKVQTRAYATCDFSLEHVENKAVSGAIWFHGLGNLCVIRDDANVSLHNTSFQEKVSFFDPNVGKAKSLIRGPLPGVSWLAKHVVAQSSSHIFPAWGSNHAKDLFTQNLYSICEALRIFTCSNFEMNVSDDRMLKDVGSPPKQMSRGLVTSLFSAGSLVKDPDAARASLDQVIKIARGGLPQTPASLARRPSSWLPWKPTQHFEMVDKLQALHSLASLTNIECAGLLADALDPLLKKTRGKKSSRSSMSLKMLAQEYLGRAQCGDSDAARTLLSFLRAQFSAKVRAQHQLPSGRDDKIGPWKVISLGDVTKISEKDDGIQLVPNFTAEFMLFGLQFMVKLLPHQGNFYIQLWQLNRDGSKARDLGSFPHPDPAQKKLEDVGRNTPDFEYTYALPDSYSPAPKRTQVILSGLFSYENDRISYKLWDRDSPSNVEEKATLTGLFEAVATKALGIDELPGQKKGAPQRFRLNDILDVVMKSWKVTPKEVEDAVGLASSHSSRAPALSDSHAPTPAGTDTSLKRPTQGTSSKASPDDSGDDPAERNAVEALMQSRTPPELPSQIPVVAVNQAPQEIAENREQKIPSSTSANASASASAGATSATATGQDSTSRNGSSSQSSTVINNDKKKNKKKKKKSDSKKPVVYELIDDSSADESDESSSDGDKSDDGDADYDPDVANPDDSDSSGLSDIDLPGVKD
ncbi:Hypothetical Protein FCC1311_076052 [Hondaea fermentalgiana]|uniref:Uncharacterized protein n=1 Tax=Hondaea fermentalgiana TaxID=2315210 RepID=A0A2R5GSM9_9STRA|nr:Hypothetical Protein FCC1311_076052 [Hondaea fermentalgiana]|eukprot:GBG31381.1 Hypothetical Protein FCC1311_076052 [Hondaea fermentalgiana]